MAATDERAIHEFPTGTIDDNSLLIMDRPTSTPGEYETEKFAIANLGLKLLGGIDFPSNLDTEEQDIFGAINEVNAKAMNIAAEYDETASYSKGDYCIYQNATYRCIKASGTTTGTFVAADWTQIKVLEEVKTNAALGAQVVLSQSEPFITYRKYGHLLFLYINTQGMTISGDVTLGNLPADCTPLMGNREYRGNGFIAVDSENNNRIWARNVETWTTCTMVLPI